MIAELNAKSMRKDKNSTLQLVTTSKIPIVFVLAYVPQGTAHSKLNFSAPTFPISLYEPNQNVILTGITYSGNVSIIR